MNIVVYLKQTFDTEAQIALTGEGKISDQNVNKVINPYDEFAIEEAIRVKDAQGGEVTVVTIGDDGAQAALRTAMAMGADKGILINDAALAGADDWALAEVLAKAVAPLGAELILSGRIAVDDGAGQLAVRLAEILGIPSVTSILKLDVADGVATVVHEIDGGSETIEVPLPALFTAQKGLNEPRYPAMAGIMKAKKKPLDVVDLAALGLDAAALAPKLVVEGYSLPAAKSSGQKIAGEPADAAKELARLLREEAKAL